MAEAVKTIMHVPNGRAYLEKIVQLTVRVPAPEPFALRRMFATGLATFEKWEHVDPVQNNDADRRLASVIDQQGGARFTTPRSVNRALDALRFVWPSLYGKVDLSDLVWVQLIRMTNADLYRWVESYSGSMAAIASGRSRVNEDAQSQSFAELEAALKADQTTFASARWQLREFLPGISTSSVDDDKRSPLFQEVSETDRLAAVKEMRLASPDHHRLYFALAMPSGAPREADFRALWEAADEGHEKVSGLLREWFADTAYGIGTKAELMLDRIRGMPAEVLDGPRSAQILFSLANVLDEPAAIGKKKDWGGPVSWREAEYLLRILHERMGGEAQAATLRAFREGSALGWLVDGLRRETFAHGRYGDQQKPESEWLLTDEEYDAVVETMHERFSSMTVAEVFATPDPFSLLFSWNQSGGAAAARNFVEKSIETDDGLLIALEHMTTKITSTRGEYRVIKRDYIAHFMDVDVVYQRVVALANAEGDLGPRAIIAKERFDNDRSF